jgi:hypothetical protein
MPAGDITMATAQQIDILYHYTSVHNANSILQSGTLWASDSRYLNDSNELFMSLAILKKYVEINYNVNIEELIEINNFSRSYCVFCFSESPKILSQWRAYSSDGKGLCLGFNKSLITLNKLNGYRANLVKCIYEDHEILIQKIMEDNKTDIEKIVETSKNIRDFQPVQLIKYLETSLDTLYTELLRVKHTHFTEEKESRLVICLPTEETKKRVSNDVIIPYTDHKLITDDEKPYLWCKIPEIWLGPKCDDRNSNAIKSFRQFGWAMDAVFKFECGYR